MYEKFINYIIEKNISTINKEFIYAYAHNIKISDITKFIKMCIEKRNQLHLSGDTICDLIGSLNDETYTKSCLQGNQKISLNWIHQYYLLKQYIKDPLYKFNFLLGDKRIFPQILETKFEIMQGFTDEYKKKCIERRLLGDLTYKLIQTIEDENYIKKCIEKSNKFGLSLLNKYDIVLSSITDDYYKFNFLLNNSIKNFETFDIIDRQHNIIKSITNKNYKKKCIEMYSELGLNCTFIYELIKDLDDETYTKKCIEDYKKLNLPKYIVYALLGFLEDTDYSKKFIEKFGSETIQKKLLPGFSQTENLSINWQKECQEQINEKNNIILSAPTGSGKTRVFLEWAKQKEEMPIFITAPIKALSNQRYRQLKEQGINVGIETGDIKNVPSNCDIICCTQEIYTSKYLDIENCTCIMDEFHYIFESEDRSRAYIDALHNSKAKNLLICSATFGNIKKFQEYVEEVSERQFHTYEGNERLTKLNYRFGISKDKISNALVVAFSVKNCQIICNELKQNRQKDINFLITESKIQQIQELAEYYKITNKQILESVVYGVTYYYGSLLPKEKLFIEQLFENRLIDTVVGTDSLAMGVNFPVQNVVFAQTVKYFNGKSISKNLFDQLAGRAGRKGYYDEGYVYFCDEFTNEHGQSIEGRNPNTGKCFEIKENYFKLLTKQNEEISITLKPDIRALLNNEKTILEECDYINKYSTEYRDVETEIIEILQSKDAFVEALKNDILLANNESTTIQNMSNEELSKKAEQIATEFDTNIGQVYFSGFEPQTNFRLFEILLKRKEDFLNYDNSNYIDDINCVLLYYLINESEEISIDDQMFNNMLQLRYYIKQLPKEYRRFINIIKLDNLINSKDDSVLSQGQGMLPIENFRKNIQPIKEKGGSNE